MRSTVNLVIDSNTAQHDTFHEVADAVLPCTSDIKAVAHKRIPSVRFPRLANPLFIHGMCFNMAVVCFPHFLQCVPDLTPVA